MSPNRSLPIDSETKEWVDSRVSWILNEFGDDRIRQCEVILPEHHFLHSYRSDEDESVRILFQRVCEFVRIDHNTVDLYYFQENERLDGGATALGLYQPDSDRFAVSIETSLLDRPQELVAVMAHELCHVHLLGHKRLTGNEYDHEPLTDLLTLFLGLGIFSSNAVLYHDTIRDGNRESWRIGRRGYLTMPIYGYAWALFASIRKEDGREWLPHLRLDVRDAFIKSRSSLDRSGYPDLSHVKSTQARPFLNRESHEVEPASGIEEQEEADGSRCTYCDAILPDESEFWVCADCQNSMQENEQEWLDEQSKIDSTNPVVVGAIVFGLVGPVLFFVVLAIVQWIYS
jgi:hypothetical protein